MSKKLIALLLAAMMMLSLAAACGNDAPAETPTTPTTPAPTTPAPTTPTTPAPTEPAKDPKYGGDLVLANTSVSTTFDGHNTVNSGDEVIMMSVYETALVTGADGKVYPLVCDYEYAEDGLTLKLTVREGKKFSNGEPVTIEDVVASWKRAAYKGGSFAQKVMNDVTDIKVEGNSATFTFSRMNVAMMQEISDPRGPGYIMPAEICEKYADGKIIDKMEDVIGSGPYVLTSYQPDVANTVSRNENYVPTVIEGATGPAAPRMAYMDTITWATNTDAASRTAAMIAGDYHAGGILTEMQSYAEQVGLKANMLHNQWTHAIFFNLSEANADSPVQDVNFRKAFRAALDMEAIALSIFNGEKRYELQASPIPTYNTTYYNTILEDTEWNIKDVELAKEYLAKTDYNGEPIKWLVSSGSAYYRAAMAAIPMLEEVGINIDLWAVDGGSHGGLRADPNAGHDIGAWETQKAVANPVTQSTLVAGTVAGWWENDKKTELITTMQNNPTGSDASVAAYEEFCHLLTDEVPWIGFCTGITKSYTTADLQLNYEGVYAYYWNAYFEK